jgi:hypothetical protein
MAYARASTVYEHGSGIRRNAHTPLRGVVGPSGPGEVPGRIGSTMIRMRGMGMLNPNVDSPMPFDPAEFANPQQPSPDMLNATPTGTTIQMPRSACPAWGCGGPSNGAPVGSAPSPGTVITLIPNPGQAPLPAPPSSAPATTLVPAATTSAAATTQPNTSTPATPSTPALVPASTSVVGGTLTALQIAAGAVGFDAAGNPVDANGNEIGTFAEVAAWMNQETLISGIPNWVPAAGVGVVLIWLFTKKK